MNHKLIIGLIVIAMATGCRSVKTSVSQVSENRVSDKKDSVVYREKVALDTARIRIDTVTIFVPYEKLVRDTVLIDPAPMTVRSGRASVSVLRMPKGIKVSAQCDSLELILVNKSVEIMNLKNTIVRVQKDMVEQESSKKTKTVTPLWAILIMTVSIALNGYFIIKKIKNSVLP